MKLKTIDEVEGKLRGLMELLESGDLSGNQEQMQMTLASVKALTWVLSLDIGFDTTANDEDGQVLIKVVVTDPDREYPL